MRATFKLFFITVFLFFTQFILSQSGTYYNSIDPNAASFVTDLENRIRNPYTKVSYDNFDETNIANFASINNGNGTSSVFCVYSHFEYIYSGTFTWLPMSREHTFCHSWQPGYPSTSLDEYSDQYHLFPTHQNGANGVRSNHPLGKVVNVISTFLEGKYGTDINGKLVYEPRDAHKGDAARALLYMPIRYNGISGYDWTFNWLNNTRLPSLSEGPQDLATLIQWHKQDPPDKWEVDRNNYIQSVQQNRNPLVDHPEYVNYIDFNNLSKLNPTYAIEPTNYVTNFTGITGASTIQFSWVDALAGTQAPSDYLLIVYDRNNYFLPIDGETYPDDGSLSDGKAVINLSYAGLNNFGFTNLTSNTVYYAAIFSYNGSGALTNYKIDGTFPIASVLFNGTLATEPTNYLTTFASGTVTTSSIQTTWTDALPGAQVPSGYLLLANKTGVFTDPSDGVMYADDTNLTDGSATVNINYSAADNYSFSGLTASTNYYFKIYSYNENPGQLNYKTDGVVPTLTVQTEANSGGGNYTDLIISEYVEGSSNNKAIEIFNGTDKSIDLVANSYKLEYYFNGATTASTTINLIGTLAVGNVFVVADASSVQAIINAANQTSSSSFFNGNDAVVVKKGNTIVDVIGQVGYDPGTQWGTGTITTLNHTLRRKITVTQGDTNPSNVFDPAIEWDGYANDTFNGLGQYEGNLPVELTSFSGRVIGKSVMLNWETATELNNYGFNIERAVISNGERNLSWEKIGFVNGNGNSNSPKDYSFVDDNISSGRYSYRLKQIDNDGQFEYSKIIEVDMNGVKKFELSQNYPNPFNPSTTIRFSLPEAGNVKLTLFNILGQEVRTLINEYKESGVHTINFEASELNSGMYIYKIEAGSFTQTKKMTLVK
ncbi:MAG: endonuclease [Ignavibacteriales bacterium]|nr:endonuclease [Ignavibacteriales bacterium]